MSKETMAVKEPPVSYRFDVKANTNVPPGYKHTEIGVIPEEWEVATLGSIASFKSGEGINVSALQAKSPDAPVPVYGGNGIAGYTAHVITKEPVVVIGRVGQKCGEVYLTQGPAWITDNALYPRVFLRQVDVRFLAYLLKAVGLNNVKNRNDLPLITQSILNSVEVLLPKSIEEQRAIAAALSDVDALIAAQDKLIAKKRAIKTATMQQLLTGKQRLPGFQINPCYKETNLGEIPEDWAVTSLSAVSAFITKGSTPTTYGFGWEKEGILFLRSECVSDDGLDLAQSMFISSEAHSVLRRSEAEPGDILITITGNVGRVVFLPEGFPNSNINQHIARIRIVSPQIHSHYVFHSLSQPSVRKHYGSITTGQAYPQISLRQVRDTQIPVPLLEEQVAITTVLSDMDTEITALEARRDKTKAIKQGMMQELLTGRTRLV